MTAEEAQAAELEIRQRIAGLCRDLSAAVRERIMLCETENFVSRPGPEIPSSLVIFGRDETDVAAFVRAAAEAGLLS